MFFDGNAMQGPAIPALLFFITVNVGFTSLGIYLFLLSIKYRLSFDDCYVTQKTLLSDQEINLQNIDSAKWRLWPKGGSIRLQTDKQKMVIEFENVQPDMKAELIRHLHSTLSHECQTGWDKFEERFKINAKPTPPASLPLVWIAIMFAAIGVFFLGGLAFGLPPIQCIAMGTINIGFACWMAWEANRRLQQNRSSIASTSSRQIGEDNYSQLPPSSRTKQSPYYHRHE